MKMRRMECCRPRRRSKLPLHWQSSIHGDRGPARFNAHVVVAVMLVLPALVALPAASVKFTALADRATVSDSVRLAFRAIVCAPELSACADAMDATHAIPSMTATTRMSLPVFIVPPFDFSFFRCASPFRQGFSSRTG